MTSREHNGRASVDLRQIEAQASDWIARRDAWPLDPAQEAALEAWLRESTHHRVAFLRLEHAWNRADRLRVQRDATLGESAPGEKGVGPANTAPIRRVPALLGGALAAAVVLGVSLFLLRHDLPWRDEAHQTYATAVGERAVITLTDGSRVTLNTNTRVRSDLDGPTRRLWLDQGEAYFEVAHDASRPFIVEAGGKRVRVVCTRFSLRRVGEDLQARVVEGRVEVSSGSGATALLGANDTASVTPSAVQVRRETPAAVTAEMIWLQGKLQLDGMTLNQAVAEFNRYNRRKLRVLDPAAGRIVIGGTFDANNAEGFARLLGTGFGLTVTPAKDEITVGSALQ